MIEEFERNGEFDETRAREFVATAVETFRWRGAATVPAEIYRKLRDLADSGAAVVFASTDMQEMTYLPDRVITFYRGMQIGDIDLSAITAARILKEITDPFNETNL